MIKSREKIYRLILLYLAMQTLGLSETVSSLSAPVGVTRIVIKGQDKALIAMPFQPWDARIQSLLASQIQADTETNSIPYILNQWDATNQIYTQAFCSAQAQWYTDITQTEPTRMTLELGQSLWFENHTDHDQAIYLWGQLSLDSEIDLLLMPGLNGLGYPYAIEPSIDESGLWQDPDSAQDQLLTWEPSQKIPWLAHTGAFRMAQGYLYDRESATPRQWTIPCPYTNLYDETPPKITDIQLAESGQALKLTLQGSGEPGERLDIFVQDSANSFEQLADWQLADTVELNTDSQGTWLDTGIGISPRPPITQIQTRYYLVSRANQDTDQDGRSDARERLLDHTDPQDPLNTETKLEKTDNPEPKKNKHRTLYVNALTGDDTHCDGLSEQRTGARGPKRTIQDALRISKPGDEIVVREGHYPEIVDIRNKGISLRTHGPVRIGTP